MPALAQAVMDANTTRPHGPLLRGWRTAEGSMRAAPAGEVPSIPAQGKENLTADC